jgi:hypothetical protein
MYFLFAIALAFVSGDSIHEPLDLSSAKPSNPAIKVTLASDHVIFDDGNEQTPTKLPLAFHQRPIAVEVFDVAGDTTTAAILLPEGKLTIVKSTGEVIERELGDQADGLDHGPNGSICSISMCLDSEGNELRLTAGKQSANQVSACRITPSTSALNFTGAGGSASITFRFSGCTRGTIGGIGSFIGLNTLTITPSTTLRLTVESTTSVRAGLIGVLGPDGRLAAMIPVEQYPTGTRRGSISPNRFLVESYAGGYTARFLTAGGWSTSTAPPWISVSGRQNQANTDVGFYVFANPDSKPRYGIVTLRSSSGGVTFIFFGQDRR